MQKKVKEKRERYNVTLAPSIVNKVKELQGRLGSKGNFSSLIENLLLGWAVKVMKMSFPEEIKPMEDQAKKEVEEMLKEDYKKIEKEIKKDTEGEKKK